ncbi:MAG: ATP-grasp domain-containing protein [Desulfurella sp.]
MTKTILIIGAGVESVPGIIIAKKMGLKVVALDMNPNAPGFNFADDKIICSTYDIGNAVIKASEYNNKNKIDGVISIATDVPLTVAKIAEKLKLCAPSVETAILASDKILMKHKLKEKGISIPWFCQIDSLKHLKYVVNEKKFNLVIKPADSRGARGVLRITKDIDLDWAYNYSLSYSPSKRVLVEEFIDGPQISTEAVIIDGNGVNVGFSERNYEYIDKFAPYIIENGGQMPSSLPQKIKNEISSLTIEAGKAIGIYNGTVKGDMVYSSEGAKVIEVAARLSGGFFSTDQIPLSIGVNLVETAIKIALGEKVAIDSIKPKYQKGVAIRYFFPKPGVVKEIKNIEMFKDAEWLYKLQFFVKPNDIVEKITDHTKRAGVVITTGETKIEAVERAQSVVNIIEIVTISNE